MKKLSFENGTFKIIQFADIQEIANFSPDTENLMRAVLQQEKPQLAVLTGDQIKGYGLSMRGSGSEAKAAKVIRKITSIFESTGTPFAVLFGNHDEFGYASKAYQQELYAQSPMYVSGGTYLRGVGVFSLPVYAADGRQIFNVYGFDSYEYNEELKRYINVPERQLELYRRERDFLKEQTGHYVPALAFQHVPVHEVHEILKRVPKKTAGAIEATGHFAGRYYVLGDTIKAGGFMRENAGIMNVNTGEFQALREKRDVLGLFFGHDHNNSFVGAYQGMDMGYAQGCGFHCYGPGGDRGVRVFTVNEATPDRYDTYTVTYGELFGAHYERPAVVKFYDHAPSSVGVAKKQAGRAALTLTAVAAAAAVTKAVCKKRLKKNI